ncbi:unnamed protein product [Withania somnifera]
MMLKMLLSWNWRNHQGVRFSVSVAAVLLLLVVGFFCSKLDDQYRMMMNNIPDQVNVTNVTIDISTKRVINMIHPSKGRPGDPPILAY